MAMRMHLRANGCRSDVIVHAAANSTVQGQLRRSPQLELRHVQLGKSELKVTEACLGTMTFGEQTEEAEAHRQLDYAIDHAGINFIDTAEVYPVAPRPETAGATSRIIGRWLRKRARRREGLVIATKVAGRSTGLEWVPAGRPGGQRGMPRVDGPSIKAAVEGELLRLQTDYIDLIQLHWPDRYIPLFGQFQYNPDAAGDHPGGPQAASFLEQVEAIGQLIQQGKVRAWGLSNETTLGVTQHCTAADQLGVPRPATVQNCYNLVHRMAEGELAEALSTFGLGLLPWSPLAGGSLTGKYLNYPQGSHPPGSRFERFAARYARFNTPRVQAAVRQYVRIAKEAGLTPAQLALAWCRTRWFVSSTIVGAQTLEQLVEDLDAWRGPPGLPQEVLDAIQEVHLSNRNPALVD